MDYKKHWSKMVTQQVKQEAMVKGPQELNQMAHDDAIKHMKEEGIDPILEIIPNGWDDIVY